MSKSEMRFLLNRFIGDGGLMAEADSALDKRLYALSKKGILELYDAMFGNRYYSLTASGRKALLSALLRRPA